MKSIQSIRSLFILSYLVLMTCATRAQEIKYPSFLWEITGNGMTKPSYLLGSVHLKDRRLINSNDSIFVAIANTQAFAMELHPDTVYKKLLDIRYNKAPLAKKMELTLSQKNEFVRRYQKEYGKAPDSIQMEDPYLIGYIMNPSHKKSDNISSILDSYLYGLAKSQRKEIIGLEPIENQLNEDTDISLTDLQSQKDSVKYYKQFENLMKRYVNGDLDGLWKMISPKIDREELKRRNDTMLNRITEQLRYRSICAVVGAAHLPGDLGLIHLLAGKGYTLRPVGTKKSNLGSKYKIDYSTMDWTLHQDSTFGYTISLPKGYAYKTNTLLETSISYGDLSTETELMITAKYVGDLHGLTAKEFLKKEFEKRTEKIKYQQVLQQPIEKDGTEGLQVVCSQNKIIVKWEFWLKNNTLYTLLGYTSNGHLDHYLANRFFNQFQIIQLADNEPTKESVYDVAAFAIKTPSAPRYLYQKTEETIADKKVQYSMHNYFSMDRSRNINYMIQYYDYPIGYTVTNRALLLQGMAKRIAQNPALNLTNTKVLEKEDMGGISLTANLEKSNLFVETWVRGNRIYQIMQENLDKDNQVRDEAFFHSFRTIPFKKMIGKTYTLNTLEIELPVSALQSLTLSDSTEQDNNETITYAAIDSNSSTTFLLEETKLSKYFRLVKSDTLYNELYKTLKSSSSQLIQYDSLKINNTINAIYTYRDTSTANYIKKIAWTQGGTLYALNAIGAKDAVEDIDLHRILKSIRYTVKPQEFDIYGSKAALLFEDLNSPDTLIAKEAKNTISTHYKFTKDELPLVYKKLLKRHADDNMDDGIRVTLINSLEDNHDKQSVTFLKNMLLESSLTDQIKTAILSTVWEIDSTQIDWYLKELNKHKPEASNKVWLLLRPLRSSKKFALDNLDKVMPLLAVDSYRSSLLNLCLTIAQDSTLPVAKKSVLSSLPIINRYMENDLENLTGDGLQAEFIDEYSMADYVELLTFYLQKNQLQKLANKLLAHQEMNYLRATTAASFLVLDLPFDQSLMDSIYKNISQRSVVMSYLKKEKRENLVPEIFKTQAEIGKIVINEYLEADWDSPYQIEYLDKLVENDQLYYIYSYKNEDEKESYLAVYIPDPDHDEWSYNYENCYSDFEPSTTNWKDHALKIIKELNGD